MEYGGDALDLSIGFLDLVQSPEQSVDVRINRSRLLEDMLYAWMQQPTMRINPCGLSMASGTRGD